MRLTPLHAAAVMSAFNTINQFVAEPLMVAFAMIVNKERGEGTTEVPRPQWNTAVQACLFDRANKPLRMRIAVRRAERCPDHAHRGRLEQVSNRTAPLLIAVANQETLRLEHAVCRIGELPCDLHNASSGAASIRQCGHAASAVPSPTP
jgi:hypothetical protein